MFKSIVRNLFPAKHWSYLGWHKDRFGFFSTIKAYTSLLWTGIGTAPNPFDGGSVFIRPGTADQSVYQQIFESKDYDFELNDPKFIVDAGAHIGLSSIFFANKYPSSTIIAIEPEPSNFTMLCKNARKYANIRPLHAGLWSKRTKLQIQNSNVATWSFRVTSDNSGNGIDAIGVLDLKKDFNVEQIDVLKIDIEGSEIEVLNDSETWLGSVKTLVIELHDRFRPGCTEALALALQNFTYDEKRSGENIVITNIIEKRESQQMASRI